MDPSSSTQDMIDNATAAYDSGAGVSLATDPGTLVPPDPNAFDSGGTVADTLNNLSNNLGSSFGSGLTSSISNLFSGLGSNPLMAVVMIAAGVLLVRKLIR